MRPQSRHRECEPAVLVGARYRRLLHARHQVRLLWSGRGPLRTCKLLQRPHGTAWCHLSLGFSPRVSATSPLDGLQDGDICPPQNSAAANTSRQAWRARSRRPGAGARGTSPERELSLGWGAGDRGNQEGGRDPEARHSRGCQPLLVLEIAPPRHEHSDGAPGSGARFRCASEWRGLRGEAVHRCGRGHCPPGPR